MDKTFFDEQQLFQLLSLLEISDAAARHGVELLPTSFRKPNAKGLELVLYRLYAIIHGEAKAAKVGVQSLGATAFRGSCFRALQSNAGMCLAGRRTSATSGLW